MLSDIAEIHSKQGENGKLLVNLNTNCVLRHPHEEMWYTSTYFFKNGILYEVVVFLSIWGNQYIPC